MKRGSGWESITQSAECGEVLAKVADRRTKDKPIYPAPEDVFRAFDDCPFSKVRVVILGQDPYIKPGQAIGRAFAVSPSTELPPSLKNIFEEVKRDCPHRSMPKPTLESWAKQGVFLLNTALTGPLVLTVHGKSGATGGVFASYAGTLNVTVVPEPSTALMMGLGLTGLGLAARRARA